MRTRLHGNEWLEVARGVTCRSLADRGELPEGLEHQTSPRPDRAVVQNFKILQQTRGPIRQRLACA